MPIQTYIEKLNERYQLGNATEHTFRGDLQNLIEALLPEIRATNEPQRQACGAPDYILTKGEIPVGYIEAKNIGDVDLEGKKKSGNKEQFDRYKASLNNLIFTDYLDFYFYQDGELTSKIAIAELTDKGIQALTENFSTFENLLKNFTTHISQTIKSPAKLAEMMAGKARLLSDIIENALNSDEDNHRDSSLKEQMNAFKEILIHDITPKAFADVYAQTIAYGMFAARLHDASLDNFSRQEAAELIPKSNPFLRRLFGYIAGPDIDDRIRWVVDNLAEIFLATNVEQILQDYGKATKMEDPIIHFYETFLSEYDPKLRKSRGVWYTPQPVVDFIVRSVDEILKTEFGLAQGLADTSKTQIKVDYQGKKINREVHKVQILDPATGTGTFLAETVKHIHKRFKGQEGIWTSYVDEHLIPRLNGFELLMASYAMAHLKMDLLMKETGYRGESDQRFRIYLTNSLEEHHPDTGTLFANWLSTEANEANHIKRDTPVMVVVGNPPYAVSSSNKGEWIESLIADYKKDLNERNIQPLSDDYIKFIRYGQYFIDKTGEGVLAYISNNSFLDGIIHRRMREHLLKTFDKIYILDLHGNSRMKEVSPDGSPDQNVFDIMAGVSINLFIKTGEKRRKSLSEIFQYDLFGRRQFKYDFLNQHSISSIEWTNLEVEKPNFFYVYRDVAGQKEYEKGFKVDELFKVFNNGIETGKDSLFYSYESHEDFYNFLTSLFNNKEKTIHQFEISDTQSFRFREKFKEARLLSEKIISINYRPFDVLNNYYDEKLQRRPAFSTMKNMFNDNLALLVPRQVGDKFHHVFISNKPTDCNLTGTAKKFGSAPIFPLYLYPDETQPELGETSERVPNLNMEIVEEIAIGLGLGFEAEKSGDEGKFAPIDLLDYIYAVLHSPAYREKYKEFLKIDFPRVPYPKDVNTFWQLVELGGEIRQIHLLESPVVEYYITTYPEAGSNEVTRKLTLHSPGFVATQDGLGQVWINDEQYFDRVPETAWNFYIGGYQPAQKWLKDRVGRTLDFEDILHYQKIIVALTETDRLMKEVDEFFI